MNKKYKDLKKELDETRKELWQIRAAKRKVVLLRHQKDATSYLGICKDASSAQDKAMSDYGIITGRNTDNWSVSHNACWPFYIDEYGESIRFLDGIYYEFVPVCGDNVLDVYHEK